MLRVVDKNELDVDDPKWFISIIIPSDYGANFTYYSTTSDHWGNHPFILEK